MVVANSQSWVLYRLVLCSIVLIRETIVSSASLSIDSSSQPSPTTTTTTNLPRPGDSCWDVSGPLEQTCFHEESLGDDPYPLTLAMLDRSVPYEASDQHLHRMFQIARDEGVMNVVVIGGSVSAGHACTSPEGYSDEDCAWPNRFQQWVDHRLDGVKMNVTNRAVPACDITCFLHNEIANVLPADADVNLVLVEHGVNDGEPDQPQEIKRAHEVLIRHIRNNMHRSPAILYMELFIAPHRVRQVPIQGSNMAEVHAQVTQKYDIPMVSFRHAVWPNIGDSTFATEVWGNDVHPRWNTHQLIADTLVYYFQKSYARFSIVNGPASNPSPEECNIRDFRRTVGCLADHIGFRLDASLFVGTSPPVEVVDSVGWDFAHDIRGKDGLIGFGNSSTTAATVALQLPCSNKFLGIIDVSFLSSYSGMGAVSVVVEGSGSGPSSSTIIDALWERSASVTTNEIIQVPAGSDNVTVTFEVLSEAREVEFESLLGRATEKGMERLDRKFKILSLQCC